MKNRNPITKLTLLFAVLLAFGAATAQANVLPVATIGFSPVGLTMDQTARLNLVNTSEPGGIFVAWRFIDAKGLVIAQSTVTLPLGTIVSIDYKRPGDPIESRAEIRAQVDIFTSVSAESLHASLEVFDNVTGATTVCMAGTVQ
jgi:hypothetical protein